MLLSAISFLVYMCVCVYARTRFICWAHARICCSSMLFVSCVQALCWLTGWIECKRWKHNVSIYNTLNVNGPYILYCSRCFLQIMHLLNSLFYILFRIGAIFAVVAVLSICVRFFSSSLLHLAVWCFVVVFLFIMYLVGCCICDSS